MRRENGQCHVQVHANLDPAMLNRTVSTTEFMYNNYYRGMALCQRFNGPFFFIALGNRKTAAKFLK